MNCASCGHDQWDHFEDEEVFEDEDGNLDESVHFGGCKRDDCDCSLFEEETDD